MSPWPLAALPWQADAWARVQQLDAADRLPHALLVAGAAGIGKQVFLQALAARLLCEDASAGTACGECKACSLLAAGSHADFMEVGPEEGSRVIKIDQVRRLIEFANRTPSLGSRKLVLLGPAETMNINAANALLKSLEEPSASTTMLLYSHQPSGLPATVRSRCQSLVLPTPEPAASLDWLEQLTGSREQAQLLLEAADARPLAARELYQQDRLEERRAVLAGLDGLMSGRVSPLEFPSLVADEDLSAVLALMQRGLEGRLKQDLMAGDRNQREAFILRDDLARLQNSVKRGANPNRQLIIEDCSARLARALGCTGT